jgi:hypothetical protein
MLTSQQIFLAPEELVTLTGYRRRADQIRWLTRKGVPHLVNAKGDPVVCRDALKGPSLPRYELGAVR